MNTWKTAVITTGIVIGITGAAVAQDAANDDPNKGKAWDRSAKSAQELKKETSEKAGKLDASGNVIMGDSDAPDKVQDTVIAGPSEDAIKRIGHIQGQVVSIAGTIDGDSDSPYALTDEEIVMLNSNGDIVLCGQSGEITNTKVWKEPGRACKMTGYKFGAPRHQILFLGEIARLRNEVNSPYYLTDEEFQLLKDKKDVTISGKTGEFVGTKDWDKSANPHPKTGFNRQSPRQAILLHYKVIEDHGHKGE